ncbi:MAG: hypothetical protein IPO27_05830 [Bacteroidetes bacterium]|nr:hypothetical protein [Bacteroidota bacterium]
MSPKIMPKVISTPAAVNLFVLNDDMPEGAIYRILILKSNSIYTRRQMYMVFIENVAVIFYVGQN